jgi:DNA-binding transcriptional MocR family regulator
MLTSESPDNAAVHNRCNERIVLTANGVNHYIVTMTNWLPDLSRFEGPRYAAIADALAADVRAGCLAPGTRLPTHRDLAWRLGVTVGTVSRAYAEAERRGLIGGEVGRGTFVKSPQPGASTRRPPEGPRLIELGVNYSPIESEPDALARALEGIARSPAIEDLLRYQPHGGRAADRAAVADWLRRSALDADPERVVITDGAQHAIAVSVAGLLCPGDALACDYLTYPGFKALASLLDVKLVPLPLDDKGVVPEAFEAACREQRVRGLYTIPNLQNPTGIVFPASRREAIARIAARHDITVIEDDVYGFLLDDLPLPIAHYAPDQTVYIGSASKSLAPGLRVGWAYAAPDKVERIAAAMRATTYMATPLMAEVLTRWVANGDADSLVAEKRVAALRRREAANRLLGRWRWDAHPRAFHLWLSLPEGWHAEDFAATSRRRGAAVTPGAAFFVGRGPAPDAVRVCLGASASDSELEEGLQILGSLLSVTAAPYLSVV